MSTETLKSSGLYYTVIDGTFRRRVEEGTPNAVKREYETKDGAKGVKYEMVIDSLEGIIEDMGIHDGNFGRTLNIRLDANQDGLNPNLQFNVETIYGEDVLRKIPGVDFSKPVKFRPFTFTKQTTGEIRGGVEIRQGENKLSNFFYDVENKKALHGLPEPAGDTDSFTRDDWKIYFMTVRKFMIKYFEEKVAPKVWDKKPNQDDVDEKSTIRNSQIVQPEDIPF